MVDVLVDDLVMREHVFIFFKIRDNTLYGHLRCGKPDPKDVPQLLWKNLRFALPLLIPLSQPLQDASAT